MADLDRLVRDLLSPFLVQGYLNGRHPLCGDCTINSRGALLASFVRDEELLGVLNSGDMTYFHSPTDSFTATDVSVYVY